MEPNNNSSQVIPGATSTTPTPTTPTPTTPSPTTQPAPREVAFTNSSPKKNMAMICGMIIFAVLAVAGIGFGVWSMLDKNQQVDTLNQQIKTLRAQNDELQEQIDTLSEQIVSPDVDEILPPEPSTAEVVVEENMFTIKTTDGDVYYQDEEHPIEEIISCESDKATPLILTCIAKTANGEATFIYNYEERSIEYIESTEEPIEPIE